MNANNKKTNYSTERFQSFNIVVFGGDGDLAIRKIYPALFHRELDGQINIDYNIVGITRKDPDEKEFFQETFCRENALPIAAVVTRLQHAAMRDVRDAAFIRTARAKGLSERVVVLKHALRNALTPVITLGALELGTLLSGAVLTEQVFTIPGFGKLIIDAVFNRDYAVVQGVVLVTATTYIMLNLFADMAYFMLNPRLRK